MQPDARLSPHFQLSEFTLSQAGARLGLANEPTAQALQNLTLLANLLLEPIRSLLGHDPLLISSGYRSPAVNRAVGGAPTSAHLQGLAADFTCPGYGTPRQVCQAIVDARLRFDQLIFEGSWVHIALPPDAAHLGEYRRDVLTAVFVPGQKPRYLKGIV